MYFRFHPISDLKTFLSVPKEFRFNVINSESFFRGKEILLYSIRIHELTFR